MSLNVSAKVEARVVENARELGVSVEDYLEQALGESEEVAADVRRLESLRPLPSPGGAQVKISRGLGQLERGEHTSGEEFMAELLAGIGNVKRRTG